MYESQRSSNSGSSTSAAAQIDPKIGLKIGPKIGGSPRVPQRAVDDPARGPMFAGGAPAWEDVAAEEAEPARPSSSPKAEARAAVAEPDSVPPQPPADALSVGGEPAEARAASAAPRDPLHTTGHDDPHAGPYERKLAHGEKQHHAAVDAYNRGGVHSDQATAHSFGRPGVVSHGHGIFQLKHDATRYTYTAQGKTNVASPFDVIAKDKLESVNPVAPHLSKHDKAKHEAELKAGKTVRLALNPSTPRQLQINGVETWCVLSWADGFGGGAAWLPVKDLVGNTSQIRHDVAALARKEDPSTKLSPSTRYVIRADKVSQADAKDKAHDGRVLAAGAHSGDNVSHYLEKATRKPEFGADGAPTGKHVQRGFVAICMNLPEGHVPPVADDTGLPGDSFFAFNDGKFHREVSVFENGKKTSTRRQTWVFGHLGRAKGGSGPDAAELEPDPKRAGWVPLRVLELA